MFLGRHVVDAALAAGHDVTLANRGKTNADLYPERRATGRSIATATSCLVETGEWDAVIDTCGYIAAVTCVRWPSCWPTGSATTLRVDGVGVHRRVEARRRRRLARRHDSTTRRRPRSPDETYGPLKVAVREQSVRDVYGDRACVVRPGSSWARTIRRTGSPTGRAGSTWAARRSCPTGRTCRCSWPTCATWRSGWSALAEAEDVRRHSTAAGRPTPWRFEDMVERLRRGGRRQRGDARLGRRGLPAGARGVAVGRAAGVAARAYEHAGMLAV